MTMTAERLAELDEAYAWTLNAANGNAPQQVGADAMAALTVSWPSIKAHIDAQAATIAGLEAERVFVLGAGECVTNWGAYHGEPCVFLEPLVGGAGVQGEPVPDSEKHDPHLLRNGSVVMVLKGEPIAFLEDIASALAELNATGAA